MPRVERPLIDKAHYPQNDARMSVWALSQNMYATRGELGVVPESIERELSRAGDWEFGSKSNKTDDLST